MKEPKQDEGDYKLNNIVILMQAMELLYETYITDDKTASYRGAAIQAINKMLEDLGHNNAIKNIEKIPYSQRRRESKIWNDTDES